METIDPKKRKLARNHVVLYLIVAALGVFGAFMMRVLINEDLSRQGAVAPGMVAVAICCAAVAIASLYAGIEYWRDGGAGGSHDARAINGRCATMAFVALAAGSAAYAKYPLPLPTQTIQGVMTDIRVDDDSVVTKLDFRIDGQPFAYDCFHRRGKCNARDQILALIKSGQYHASVIPVGSTILSLAVNNHPIIDASNEGKGRLFSAIYYLFFAVILGAIAWGDWRGYAIFRKPLKG